METYPVSEAKMKLSGLVDFVSKTEQEIMITKNGRAAAMLISIEEYESWRETLRILKDPDTMKEIHDSAEAFKKGESTTYSFDQLDELFE